LWLSIIHQRNKINKFDGYGLVKWEDIRKNFTLSDEANKLILEKTIPYSNWIFTSIKNQFLQTFELNFKLLKRKLGLYKAK
jgi:hypothetical protein